MKQAAQCAIVLEKQRKRVTSFESFLKQDAGMLSCATSCEVQASFFFGGNCLEHSSLFNYLFPTPPQHMAGSDPCGERHCYSLGSVFEVGKTNKYSDRKTVTLHFGIDPPACLYEIYVYIKLRKREIRLLVGVKIYT